MTDDSPLPPGATVEPATLPLYAVSVRTVDQATQGSLRLVGPVTSWQAALTLERELILSAGGDPGDPEALADTAGLIIEALPLETLPGTDDADPAGHGLHAEAGTQWREIPGRAAAAWLRTWVQTPTG